MPATTADNKPYNDFSQWLRTIFPFRVQKISVDAAFTCPNRDGTIGYGGCTFCNNATFNPTYCNATKSIAEQLDEGKRFFRRKYPYMRYLAYFQAYSNTYGSLEQLKRKYEEALKMDDVVGIVIGTRPDCISTELLDYLQSLSRHTFVMIEYGIESANNATLSRVNRGHTFECAVSAIEETKDRDIVTGGHVIIGLPGEDRSESLRQAQQISSTKLDILKIHQLQVVRGTALELEYNRHPFHLYSVEEYIDLLSEYIQRLRPSLMLERFVSQSPKHLIVAPSWGLKNYEFTHLLINHMRKIGAYQGKKVGQ